MTLHAHPGITSIPAAEDTDWPQILVLYELLERISPNQMVTLNHAVAVVVMPPGLPEALAVEAASRLRASAAAVGVDIAWLETPLDAEFSLIRHRRADAGLGWLAPAEEALAAPLDVMNLGEFEPDVWIPASHPAARRETISLCELARMDVIHGPPRSWAATYGAWLAVLRTIEPRFEFTDPPFRNSLQITLAFAATGNRPTAVLTCPRHAIGARKTPRHIGRRIPATWSPSASTNLPWPRTRAWCGTATCRARCSRFSSTPQTASFFDPRLAPRRGSARRSSKPR